MERPVPKPKRKIALVYEDQTLDLITDILFHAEEYLTEIANERYETSEAKKNIIKIVKYALQLYNLRLSDNPTSAAEPTHHSSDCDGL